MKYHWRGVANTVICLKAVWRGVESVPVSNLGKALKI